MQTSSKNKKINKNNSGEKDEDEHYENMKLCKSNLFRRVKNIL